jgi:ribosomal protein S18 acetylase RimI-like enzyme
MTIYSTQPALDFSLVDLADLFTRSFAGYFMPVNMTVPALVGVLRRDGADLSASRVLLADGAPSGFGLIARRGWTSRLGAMGIVETLRGKGAGAYLMAELIREARERGEHGMVLEVIEQNVNAIALYEKYGFKKVRRLVGLSLANPPAAEATPLAELDLRAVANLVGQFGLPDLPWQMAGETVATLTPPARAYKLDSAYAVITNPEVERVSFWTILVEPQVRRQGQATRLIQAVIAAHPGKTWHVPAIFPEETVGPFARLSFQREEISQFQMSLDLH